MAGNDINQWLSELGLSRYQGMFANNDIDFRTLPHLTEEDFRELGIFLGHRRLLMRAIADLSAATRAAGGSGQFDPREAATPERRQLTVMFSDIVGSTELVHSMDAEDMREVLRQYQDAVGNAVRRYNGYVARFFGDGILSYFGWPRAYEDQAERAIRASLEAALEVTRVNIGTGRTLQARCHQALADLGESATENSRLANGIKQQLASVR